MARSEPFNWRLSMTISILSHEIRSSVRKMTDWNDWNNCPDHIAQWHKKVSSLQLIGWDSGSPLASVPLLLGLIRDVRGLSNHMMWTTKHISDVFDFTSYLCISFTIQSSLTSFTYSALITRHHPLIVAWIRAEVKDTDRPEDGWADNNIAAGQTDPQFIHLLPDFHRIFNLLREGVQKSQTLLSPHLWCSPHYLQLRLRCRSFSHHLSLLLCGTSLLEHQDGTCGQLGRPYGLSGGRLLPHPNRRQLLDLMDSTAMCPHIENNCHHIRCLRRLSKPKKKERRRQNSGNPGSDYLTAISQLIIFTIRWSTTTVPSTQCRHSLNSWATITFRPLYWSDLWSHSANTSLTSTQRSITYRTAGP